YPTSLTGRNRSRGASGDGRCSSARAAASGASQLLGLGPGTAAVREHPCCADAPLSLAAPIRTMLPSADSATDGAEFRGRTRPPIPSTNATSDGEVGPTMVHLIKFEDNAASAHLSSVDTRRTCRIVLVV